MSAGAQTSSSLNAEFEASAKVQGPDRPTPDDGLCKHSLGGAPVRGSEHEEGEAIEEVPQVWGAYVIMQLVQNPSRDTPSEAAALTESSEEQLKPVREQNGVEP
jgi:hypothetical protein